MHRNDAARVQHFQWEPIQAEQVPGESASIVTPMQSPASKKSAKRLSFSTGPKKSSV